MVILSRRSLDVYYSINKLLFLNRNLNLRIKIPNLVCVRDLRSSKVYIRPNNIYTGPSMIFIHTKSVPYYYFIIFMSRPTLIFPSVCTQRSSKFVRSICWYNHHECTQHNTIIVQPHRRTTRMNPMQTTHRHEHQTWVWILPCFKTWRIFCWQQWRMQDAFQIQFPTILNTGTCRHRETLH